MSRKPPARVIRSSAPHARDRRNSIGLSDLEARRSRGIGHLLSRILLTLGVIAAVAIWGSAFAAAALALSGDVGTVALERGFGGIYWMLG